MAERGGYNPRHRGVGASLAERRRIAGVNGSKPETQAQRRERLRRILRGANG